MMSTTILDFPPSTAVAKVVRMTVGERIQERIDAIGISQAAIAREIGVSPQAVSKMVRGDTHQPQRLYQLARALKTTPEYLLGETDDPLPPLGEKQLAWRGPPSELPDGTVMIPQLDIGYSMGGGTVFEEYAQTALIPFPREWLRPLIGGTFGDLFVARGEGDSMMPTILDSDVVIIDTAQKTIVKQDRLWCLNYGELGMIKRVRMQPDGGALIISDNPAVENFTAYDGEVQAIGRVIWIGRRV
ncbi:S24 family peptidase [Porphyrobacter sp. YT40]|uniref:XRE family transcriptional regulator n=1 Tax=Porphyrobacter sp. YT40 TaxID=2547601 RepID=UPI0011418CF1|nr:S24 family peptidase [Porphyrobacter sp. YT40]QDH33998.1 helix-turn-helix transcriptional regulator [Porphyrobacter sp. YT40]